jgi:hypothetical protein
MEVPVEGGQGPRLGCSALQVRIIIHKSVAATSQIVLQTDFYQQLTSVGKMY